MVARLAALALAVSSATFASPQEAVIATSASASSSRSLADAGPIRMQHRFELALESAWNGLTGTGVMLSYNLEPHLAIDAGAGLGFAGWKVGGRLRYNFSLENLTPFVAAGYSHGFGLGTTVHIPADAVNPAFDYTYGQSNALQAVGGLAFQNANGFSCGLEAGYTKLLNPNNYSVSGGATDQQVTFVRVLGGSGITLGGWVGVAL